MTFTTLPTPSMPLRDRMIEDMKLHRLCQRRSATICAMSSGSRSEARCTRLM